MVSSQLFVVESVRIKVARAAGLRGRRGRFCIGIDRADNAGGADAWRRKVWPAHGLPFLTQGFDLPAANRTDGWWDLQVKKRKSLTALFACFLTPGRTVQWLCST